MIRTDLIQGTPEWHAWRDCKITASDIASILGESDFDTAKGVWDLKTKRVKPKESNFVMQRGTDTEPKIRALYALENDIDASPVLAEHDEYPFIGASLDGYNEEFMGYQGLVVEIKYPGKEKHQMAVEGLIPECYRAQVQVQLACANAKYCDYVSYNGESIAVVRVERDDAWFELALPRIKEFWSYVLTDTPPPLTDRDFMVLEDDPAKEVFEKWKRLKLIQMQMEEIPELKKELKEVEKQIEVIRAAIKVIMPHPKVLCSGVKATTVKRKTGATIQVGFEEAV